MIALVALLREPASFDPAVLARLAGKAWNVDLGDGTSEGADGFVAGVGEMNTIMHEGRMFLINNFPAPYTEDPDQAAEAIPDMRIRSLFREHRAWFSCDALGVDGTTSDDEVREWYRRLGKLFAELLDDNCLMIVLPDSGRGYPLNEDSETALRSDDPVKSLQDTLTVPLIEVPPDDPLMVQAEKEAREAWPRFVAAYESKGGTGFSVKAPVTQEGNTEFIWISITALEGDLAYGELGNDPHNLGSLKIGSKVSVPVADLNDWCYVDSQGDLQGCFTVAAVHKASRRARSS
jgi:uncharacterized protein YegJ (DUF2314 family)